MFHYPKLTRENVERFFEYDPDTGNVCWSDEAVATIKVSNGKASRRLSKNPQSNFRWDGITLNKRAIIALFREEEELDCSPNRPRKSIPRPLISKWRSISVDGIEITRVARAASSSLGIVKERDAYSVAMRVDNYVFRSLGIKDKQTATRELARIIRLISKKHDKIVSNYK